MTDKPWFKFYPSDFIAGVAKFTAAHRGVYITLLCQMYEDEGPLERDDGQLARLCGTTKGAFIKALEALMRGKRPKIIEKDGFLYNERAQKLIHLRQKATRVKSEAASQGWEKRQQNQQPDDADASSEKCKSGSTRARVRSQKPDSSVTDVTGAPAPETPPEPPDPKEVVWGAGLKWLCMITGKTEKQMRPTLGRWCRDHGEPYVIAKLGEARGRVDPTTYLHKVFGVGGRNGTSPGAKNDPMLEGAFRSAQKRKSRANGKHDRGTLEAGGSSLDIPASSNPSETLLPPPGRGERK